MIRLALVSFALLAFAAACGGGEEVFTLAGESYTEDEWRQAVQDSIDENGYEADCSATPAQIELMISVGVSLGAVETIEEATRMFAIQTEVCEANAKNRSSGDSRR